MNGDEATSLFLCIPVRMMAKGFASGSYEVPRLAFVAGGWGVGVGGYLARLAMKALRCICAFEY